MLADKVAARARMTGPDATRRNGYPRRSETEGQVSRRKSRLPDGRAGSMVIGGVAVGRVPQLHCPACPAHARQQERLGHGSHPVGMRVRQAQARLTRREPGGPSRAALSRRSKCGRDGAPAAPAPRRAAPSGKRTQARLRNDASVRSRSPGRARPWAKSPWLRPAPSGFRR